MLETTFLGLTGREIIISISLFLGFLVLAWIVNLVLTRVVKGLVQKTGTSLVLLALRRPIYIAFGLAGLYLAVMSLPLTDAVRGEVARWGYAAMVAIGIFLVVSVIDVTLKWYALEIAPKTETGLDDRITEFLRWAVPIVGIILGLLAALEVVGVSLPLVRTWLIEHGITIALIVALSLAGTFTVSQLGPKIIRAAVHRRVKEEAEEEVKKRAHTLAGVFVTTAQIVIMGKPCSWCSLRLALTLPPSSPVWAWPVSP